MPGKSHYYGLILAGGRGTRFWPRSRRSRAKQVLSVVGELTMIQATAARLKAVIPPERIWVMTNGYLQAEIRKQLPDVPREQILAEPQQRNTAPAIGLAAHILHSIDKNAVMGVFPSDHVISKPSRYLRLVRPALKAASEGKIVVLGIQPRHPETGFGYIEFPRGVEPGSVEAQAVASFREKPDADTAKQYVDSGNFYWNAGMFFWRAEVLLNALREHLPRTATLLSSLPPFGDRRFNARVKDAFPKCENISVDYAVLEKASGVVGLTCDEFGWSDVGSWDAVHHLLPHDEAGNVSRGEAMFRAAGGNYVDAQGKLVALLGVDNLIVVDTKDALLVAGRSRAQEVGDIVKALEKKDRWDLL